MGRPAVEAWCLLVGWHSFTGKICLTVQSHALPAKKLKIYIYIIHSSMQIRYDQPIGNSEQNQYSKQKPRVHLIAIIQLVYQLLTATVAAALAPVRNTAVVSDADQERDAEPRSGTSFEVSANMFRHPPFH